MNGTMRGNTEWDMFVPVSLCLLTDVMFLTRVNGPWCSRHDSRGKPMGVRPCGRSSECLNMGWRWNATAATKKQQTITQTCPLKTVLQSLTGNTNASTLIHQLSDGRFTESSIQSPSGKVCMVPVLRVQYAWNKPHHKTKVWTER